MERRYVVLGLRNPDGSLGFGLTSNPLAYLVKNQTGEFVSLAVHAGGELQWAISQPSHEHAAALRDQLNDLGHDAAAALASDQSVPGDAIQRLRELAADALPAYRSDAVIEIDDIELAWKWIPPVEIPQPPVPPPADLDLDDPFEPLPESAWPPRIALPWDGVEALPADLFIFDLDDTLVDTSGLAQARELARQNGDWGPVRAALDRVEPLRCWGDVAPHELPGVLKQYGYRVAVISRAPRWYLESIVARFNIEADETIWACGPNKTAAFERAISRADARPERTWVFGDDASDFRAADAIGSWHLGNPWVSAAMSPRYAPDIAWFDAERLLAEPRWTDLRYLGETEDPADVSWHCGSLLSFGDEAIALGRYFKASHNRHRERLSSAILEAKDRTQRHPVLEAALKVVIPKLATREQVDAVVSIPPHAGRPDRFEGYRELLCAGLGASDDVDVRIASPVPSTYKYLPRDRKRALRAGRYACHDDLSRQTVLVIDDVTTTGSTIGAMSDALYEAGASRVIQLAWGVTQD